MPTGGLGTRLWYGTSMVYLQGRSVSSSPVPDPSMSSPSHLSGPFLPFLGHQTTAAFPFGSFSTSALVQDERHCQNGSQAASILSQSSRGLVAGTTKGERWNNGKALYSLYRWCCCSFLHGHIFQRYNVIHTTLRDTYDTFIQYIHVHVVKRDLNPGATHCVTITTYVYVCQHVMFPTILTFFNCCELYDLTIAKFV